MQLASIVNIAVGTEPLPDLPPVVTVTGHDGEVLTRREAASSLLLVASLARGAYRMLDADQRARLDAERERIGASAALGSIALELEG